MAGTDLNTESPERTPQGVIARDFGRALVDRDFVKAHELLAPELKTSHTPEELARLFDKMVEYFDAPPTEAPASEAGPWAGSCSRLRHASLAQYGNGGSNHPKSPGRGMQGMDRSKLIAPRNPLTPAPPDWILHLGCIMRRRASTHTMGW